MGIGPEKEKILKILENSVSNFNKKNFYKIEYKYKYENLEVYNENDSFNFSLDEEDINSPENDIKNIKLFPYVTIGVLSVKFPISNETYFYTCFAIDTNVIVTLASNLEDKNKGGKAKSIITSFSDEKVKWENIHFQNEYKETNMELIKKNLKSNLAVILYEENILNEWIGLEQGKREDFSIRDINAVFSLGLKKDITNNEDIETEKSYKNKDIPYLREVNVNYGNPFKDLGNSQEKEIVKSCPGSPIYYKDYNSGAYVIAIINEFLEFQYFNRDDLLFLYDMLNKGKLLRKKIHKGIDEDNIVKLDLSRNGFNSIDIKYLTDFDLKNLRILDLSSNSIGVQGAFFISQGKFSRLESLNLNLNEIRDEGLLHISNGFFCRLNYLYLLGNNISSKGIQNLVKAEFVNNLIILNLSENRQIGDFGIKIMKEHKGWSKLNALYLNATGLTDMALTYIGEATMPKLKTLYIIGNKFTPAGKTSINGLRMNHIHVSYRTQAERDKEREEARKKMIKEKKKEDIKNKENNKNKIQGKNKDLENDYYLLKKFKNNSLNKYLNY